MVDPIKISNFNLTDKELEEVLLFWICAAGKNGITAARLLDDFLNRLRAILFTAGYNEPSSMAPFDIIKTFLSEIDSDTFQAFYEMLSFVEQKPINKDNVFQEIMRSSGIGNHTMKSRAFIELAHSGLNLRTCTVDDLSQIHGIGPKTSRAFIVHSRPNQRFAIIDTHVLKFLRHQGIMVPKSTPPEGKLYQSLEKVFLDICDKYELDTTDFDLTLWNHYRQKPDIPFNVESYANYVHAR